MLSVIILLLFFLAIFLGLYLIKKIGKGSINVFFISATVSVFLLAVSKLFLYLLEEGYYDLSEVTGHLWWHLIFYLAIFCFLWGSMRLRGISNGGFGFGFKDIFVLGSFCMMTIFVFLVAKRLEFNLSNVVVGSWFDLFGVHHIIAVILAFLAGVYVRNIRNDWGNFLSASVNPILIFLFLLSLQHSWELLTESFKIIKLSFVYIESIEDVVTILALMSLNFGFLKVIRFNKSQHSSAVESTQIIV